MPLIVSGERDMKNIVTRFVRDEEGQDLIEYSLLAALHRGGLHPGDADAGG